MACKYGFVIQILNIIKKDWFVMEKDEMLTKAYFEEIKGIKVLHIKGKPYEMGYQHGYLLADKIDLMIKRTLLATTAYVASQTGLSLEKAEEILRIGQKAAEPFLPSELKEELVGIVDGVKDAGVNVTLEEILLWNTNYDQWCIYSLVIGKAIVKLKITENFNH